MREIQRDIADYTIEEIRQANKELEATWPEINNWTREEILTQCDEIRLRA